MLLMPPPQSKGLVLPFQVAQVGLLLQTLPLPASSLILPEPPLLASSQLI